MKNSIFNPILISAFLILSLLLSCDEKDDILNDNADTFIVGFVEDISADSLLQNVLWLQNMGSRFFLLDNHRQVAQDIKNKFLELGFSNARLDSFYMDEDFSDKTDNTCQYNVIAYLEGSLNPDSVYIMGAHYDCISSGYATNEDIPGANDNASGVSALLEVARVMKARNFIPKNTIEFVAFAAEESGLNGSADYARKAIDTQKKIVTMINNDMIANISGAKSSWEVNVMYYDNSLSIHSSFVACGEIYSRLNFVNYNNLSHSSDSYSFYKEGYKAIYLKSGEWDDNYHTSKDLAKNCNFNYCREVTALSCAYLVQENK